MQEELNQAIAQQIGALIIENHALKLQVAGLQRALREQPVPTPAAAPAPSVGSSTLGKE